MRAKSVMALLWAVAPKRRLAQRLSVKLRRSSIHTTPGARGFVPPLGSMPSILAMYTPGGQSLGIALPPHRLTIQALRL